MTSSPRILLCVFTLATALSAPGCQAATQAPPATAALQTEDQKTLYALGLMLGRNLTAFGLTPAELDVVKRGISDAVGGKTTEVDLQTYGPKVQEMHRTRVASRAEAEKKKSEAYLETAAKEQGATKTSSGLIYTTVKAGAGASPAATDKVKVHYKGTLLDGTEFDSSIKRGQPAEFPLNAVIPCWTEGVQKMKVGEKAKLVCPSSIAYGDQGQGTIPGGATLTFEVELIEIISAPKSPAPEKKQ